jgi:uncharacterized lipoprotein YajG
VARMWHDLSMEAARNLILALVIAAGLLTGCSSEPSAQEKRNLFDKCVLDYIADNPPTSVYNKDFAKNQAPFECRYLLG